jgi:hypothetical protein
LSDDAGRLLGLWRAWNMDFDMGQAWQAARQHWPELLQHMPGVVRTGRSAGPCHGAGTVLPKFAMIRGLDFYKSIQIRILRNENW